MNCDLNLFVVPIGWLCLVWAVLMFPQALTYEYGNSWPPTGHPEVKDFIFIYIAFAAVNGIILRLVPASPGYGRRANHFVVLLSCLAVLILSVIYWNQQQGQPGTGRIDPSESLTTT
jgi:hypothetical protein